MVSSHFLKSIYLKSTYNFCLESPKLYQLEPNAGLDAWLSENKHTNI